MPSEALACVELCPLCGAPLTSPNPPEYGGALGDSVEVVGCSVRYWPRAELVTMVCATRPGKAWWLDEYAVLAMYERVPFYAFRDAVGHFGFARALWGNTRRWQRRRGARAA